MALHNWIVGGLNRRNHWFSGNHVVEELIRADSVFEDHGLLQVEQKGISFLKDFGHLSLGDRLAELHVAKPKLAG